jgi:hypothetical protein
MIPYVSTPEKKERVLSLAEGSERSPLCHCEESASSVRRSNLLVLIDTNGCGGIASSFKGRTRNAIEAQVGANF